MDRVLDFSPRPEADAYPHGKVVESVLEDLVSRFNGALSENLLSTIEGHISRLKEAANRLSTSNPSNKYPLKDLKQSAPIYAAFTRQSKDEASETTLAPARIALIYYLFDSSEATSDLPIDLLSDLCLNWKTIIVREIRDDIAATLAGPIRSLDWVNAREERDLKYRHFFSETRVRRQRFGALGVALDYLQMRTECAQFGKTVTVSDIRADRESRRRAEKVGDDDRTPSESWKTTTDPLADPGSVDEQHAFFTGLAADRGNKNKDLRSALKDATPEQQRAVALQGYRIRLRRRFGLCSDEALYPAQAQLVMDELLKWMDQSDGYAYIAAAQWLLCAVTGQRLDALRHAFLDEQPAGQPVRPVLRLNVGQETSTITVPWLNVEYLPKTSPHNDVAAEYELALPITGTLIRSLQIYRSLKKRESQRNLMLRITRYEGEIRDKLRKKIDVFTETRLRGSLFQAFFAHRFDLPLTQAFAHERLEQNPASLHYIAVDQHQIQDTYDAALRELYGTRFAPPARLERNPWSGAPLARLALEKIPQLGAALAHVVPRPPPPRLDNAERLAAHHNQLCDLTALMLFVATGHRGTRDFEKFRAVDLTTSAGAVVYSDKPNDPAVFRRLAVFPPAVCDQLHRYRQHLKRLSAKSIEGFSTSLYTSINRAHDGENPLFFRIQVRGAEWIPRQWSLKTAWRHYAPDGLDENACRHAMSTYLRRQGVQGLWIESQLGHATEASLFGRQGLVSCLEFSSLMAEPLEQFLEYCGFSVSATSKRDALWCGRDSPVRISGDLAREEKDILSQDTARIRALYKFDGPPSEKRSIQQVIDNTLRAQLGEYHRHAPPHGVFLTKAQIDTLAREVVKQIANPSDSPSAINQFKGRLAFHRARHDWRLHLPEQLHRYAGEPLALTWASLSAYERVLGLRHGCEQAMNAPADDRQALTALILVLWGAVNPEQVIKVLDALPKARYCNNPPILMVPIGLAKDKDKDKDKDKENDNDGRDIALSLTGVAAAAAIGYLHAFRDSLPETPTVDVLSHNVCRIMPKEYRAEHPERLLNELYSLVRLGRKVEAPGLLASIESGVVSSRQLPVDRLYKWHENVATPIAISETRPERAFQPSIDQAHVDIKKEEAKAYNQLCQALRNPRAFHETVKLDGAKPHHGPATPRRIQRPITRWLSECSPPPLSALLATWAWHLANPGTNRRTGKYLSINTIRTYVSIVKRPLFEGLQGIDLADIDVELLHECLSNALTTQDEADSLNRMFTDLREYTDLPPLALNSAGHGSSIAAIDANVITPAELSVALQTLEQGAANTWRSVEQRQTLAELHSAIDWIHASGMRRSEAAYLQNRDLRLSGPLAHVTIRATRDRPLKSAAAKRTIELHGCLAPLPDQAAEPRQRVWPRLLDNQALPDALAFGTSVLRAATGDHHFRLHHLRHTRATRSLECAFGKPPLARLVDMHRLTGDLGHSVISTTAQHYGHTLQEQAAVRYQPTVDAISQTSLARLLDCSYGALRQRLSRAGKDPAARALAVLRSHPGANFSPPSSEPGALSLPDNVLPAWQPLTANDAIKLLYRLARGDPLNEILIEIPIAQPTLIEVLTAAYNLAQEIGWSPISVAQLTSELDRCNVPFNQPPMGQKNFPLNRHNLLRTPIERWCKAIRTHACDLSSDLASGNFSAYLSGFRWQTTPPCCIFSNESRAQQFEKLISAALTPPRNRENCRARWCYHPSSRDHRSRLSDSEVDDRPIHHLLLAAIRAQAIPRPI